MPFLATGYMVMLPKHVLDGRADAEEFFDTPENIVGSGAFTFVNHERGSSMKIEKNPNYFKEGCHSSIQLPLSLSPTRTPT